LFPFPQPYFVIFPSFFTIGELEMRKTGGRTEERRRESQTGKLGKKKKKYSQEGV